MRIPWGSLGGPLGVPWGSFGSPVGGPRRPHRQITMKAQRFNLTFGRSLEDPLEVPWGPFEAPGGPWKSLGCSLGSLGDPLGDLGDPLAPLGVPGGPWGVPWGSLAIPNMSKKQHTNPMLCYAMFNHPKYVERATYKPYAMLCYVQGRSQRGAHP